MELKIKNIHYLNDDTKDEREIIVDLTNGTKVHIISCYESWQQYGGTTNELYLTMPIAEQNNKWLHGHGTHTL